MSVAKPKCIDSLAVTIRGPCWRLTAPRHAGHELRGQEPADVLAQLRAGPAQRLLRHRRLLPLGKSLRWRGSVGERLGC
jgi:hypothetical protein